MIKTKVIAVNPNSLGFEVGENPKWRGEFTLEQVAQFEIGVGKDLIVNFIEMEDTFASVEFDQNERTIVPITRLSQDNEHSFSAPPEEPETPEMNDTLKG